MKYIKKYESNYSNRIGGIKKFFGFTHGFMNYEKDGIKINIQPGFKSSKEIDSKIEDFIKKIKKVSVNYQLLGNIDIYSRPVEHKLRFVDFKFILNMGVYVKFRITDISGDNKFGADSEIPEDIKSEMIDYIYKHFGKDKCIIDEFPDRGYLVVEVELKNKHSF